MAGDGRGKEDGRNGRTGKERVWDWYLHDALRTRTSGSESTGLLFCFFKRDSRTLPAAAASILNVITSSSLHIYNS